MLDFLYCPVCGKPLAPSKAATDAQRCASCGAIHWRNSVPAATAIILRGREILLSRRAGEPKKGLWDLPGGFLEWGEAPREGMARELREETGREPRVGRLLATPIGIYEHRASLNFVFECELDGEPTPSDDSMDMRWFPLDAIPPMAFEHEARVVAAVARGERLAP